MSRFGTFQINCRANTVAMVGQSNTPNKAGTLAQAYRGPNNLSDWFLPSRNELNQMCKWARGFTDLTTSSLTTDCKSGTLNTGLGAAGFLESYYYSSSEETDGYVRLLDFFGSGGWGSSAKSSYRTIHPVRAF